MTTATPRQRHTPYLVPEYCKGCGRCIDACPKHCLEVGDEVNPKSGLVPIHIDLAACNGCGLCIGACPEPFGPHVASSSSVTWQTTQPENTKNKKVKIKHEHESGE